MSEHTEYRGVPEGEGWEHVGEVWVHTDGVSPFRLSETADRYGWSYSGGGPTDLAHDMLVHALAGVEPSTGALFLFRDLVIANLPKGAWTLTREQVMGSLVSIGRQLNKAAKTQG